MSFSPPKATRRTRSRFASARWLVEIVLVGIAASAGACGNAGSETDADPGAADAGAAGSGAAGSAARDASAKDANAGDASTTGPGVTDAGLLDSSAADATPPARSTAASCTNGVAGTWQDITPPAVAAVLADGGITEASTGPGTNGSWGTSSIVVDPGAPSTLYVSADGQGIFKSLDCGGTWARIDDPSDDFSRNTGSVYSWALVIDPTDTQVLYANDGYGPLGVYKSTNGGQNFTQTFVGNLVGPGMGAGMPVTSVFVDGGFIGSIRMDPTNHQHLLVAPHHSCVSPFPQYCLLETLDGAATWTVIDTNIDVANADGPWADIIDATHFVVSGMPQGGLFLSTNGGADWSTAPGITDNVYGWVYHSPTTGKYLLTSENGVLESADGVAWSVLAGTPQTISNGTLTGDGKNLYLARAFPGFTASFSTAAESDPTRWTTLANPPAAVGFVNLVMEPVNHFLYSSDTFGGLWRYGAP